MADMLIGLPRHADAVRPGDLLVLSDHRTEVVRMVELVEAYRLGQPLPTDRVRIKVGRSWLTCDPHRVLIVRVPFDPKQPEATPVTTADPNLSHK